KNVAIITCFNSRSAFNLAEMIYAQVVGNTHSPGQKFSFFCVTATANGVNNSDKNILKNVFSQVLVFYQKKNGSVDLVFVANNEDLKSGRISTHKQVDQLLVRQIG